MSSKRGREVDGLVSDGGAFLWCVIAPDLDHEETGLGCVQSLSCFCIAI